MVITTGMLQFIYVNIKDVACCAFPSNYMSLHLATKICYDANGDKTVKQFGLRCKGVYLSFKQTKPEKSD